MVGGLVQSLIGSSCQTVAEVIRHATASISLLEWNATTNSITINCSMPLGCTCPIHTHNSTMSSCKELASNRVPSPLAIVRTHIWLANSGSLPRVWSLAAEAVALDLLRWSYELILLGKGREKGVLWCSEKSVAFTTAKQNSIYRMFRIKLNIWITRNTNLTQEKLAIVLDALR